MSRVPTTFCCNTVCMELDRADLARFLNVFFDEMFYILVVCGIFVCKFVLVLEIYGQYFLRHHRSHTTQQSLELVHGKYYKE